MAAACAACALPGAAWRANPTRALLSRRMFVCGALRSFLMVSRDPDRRVCAQQRPLGAPGAWVPLPLLSCCPPAVATPQGVIGLL